MTAVGVTLEADDPSSACAASATRMPGDQVALDGIDLDIDCGEQVVPARAPTARANRPCSSCSTASSRRPAGYAARPRPRRGGGCRRSGRLQLPSRGRARLPGPGHPAVQRDRARRRGLRAAAARPDRRTKSRRACDAALEQMDIAHLADRAPFELSGGEKKRAAIASVLSLRPERAAARRADGGARPAHQVGAGQPDPAAGRRRQDHRHRDARAGHRAAHRGSGGRAGRGAARARGRDAGGDPGRSGAADSGEPDPRAPARPSRHGPEEVEHCTRRTSRATTTTTASARSRTTIRSPIDT